VREKNWKKWEKWKGSKQCEPLPGKGQPRRKETSRKGSRGTRPGDCATQTRYVKAIVKKAQGDKNAVAYRTKSGGSDTQR